MADEGIDPRQVISLSPQHRETVLVEMRQFLSGLQRITTALAREDMETVAVAARGNRGP